MRSNLKMVQYRVVLTMTDQQKVVYDLSNGAIFNYLERPLYPQFQGYAIFDDEYLINGLKIRPYIVTMEGEKETAHKLSNGTSLNDLQ